MSNLFCFLALPKSSFASDDDDDDDDDYDDSLYN